MPLARMAKRLAKRVVLYTDGAEELESQIAMALGEDVGGVLMGGWMRDSGSM